MRTRRWLLVALLALASGGFATSERGVVLVPDGEGREVALYRGSHALLIGVSDYTNGWPNLESVPGEIERIEQVLRAQGFSVEKSLNPNARRLEQAFEDFIRKYGFDTENRLLFYFAGHGHTRKGGAKGYLVPADAPDPRGDEKGFMRKALDMSQIIAWTRRIEAKHALFLFDSCFSGTVFKARDLPERPRHINTLTRDPVRQFITAGSAGETVPAKSTFAQVFVDGIEHRQADLDKDGFVTGTELGFHIQSTVPKHVPQTPQFGKHPDYELSRGDFVFILSRQEVASFRVNYLYRARGSGPVQSIKKGTVLHSGDYYKIEFTPNTDAYVYIFQVDANDEVFKLFPMQAFKDVVVNNANPVRKGKKYVLPAPDKAFRLDQTRGRERFFFVASREPNKELERLYRKLQQARTRGQGRAAKSANSQLKRNLRGLDGIVSNVKFRESGVVPWNDTPVAFSMLEERLENLCEGCVSIVEFDHQ